VRSLLTVSDYGAPPADRASADALRGLTRSRLCRCSRRRIERNGAALGVAPRARMRSLLRMRRPGSGGASPAMGCRLGRGAGEVLHRRWALSAGTRSERGMRCRVPGRPAPADEPETDRSIWQLVPGHRRAKGVWRPATVSFPDHAGRRRALEPPDRVVGRSVDADFPQRRRLSGENMTPWRCRST